MAYFPFFIDIAHKKCCIVGGGMVAYRKIEALLEFEADITVIAPVFCREIQQLEDSLRLNNKLRLDNKLQLLCRAYDERLLADAFLVIAATDDRKVNSDIAKYCRRMNIPVNTVDEIENCSFLFPAYVKKGSICVGITTSGKSPVMAGILKNAVGDALPDFYETLIDSLGTYREYVKGKVSSSEVRAAVFKELALLGIKQEGRITEEDVTSVIKAIEGKRQ